MGGKLRHFSLAWPKSPKPRRNNDRGTCGPTRAYSSGGGVRQASRPPSSITTSRRGGTINYFMSGPDGGEGFVGTWNVIEVDAPTRLVVEDAIVEDDGTPSDGNSMTRMEIDIEAVGDTTRMILTTHFDSLEGMEQAIAMGVADGMKACMSQIDALLAEIAA